MQSKKMFFRTQQFSLYFVGLTYKNNHRRCSIKKAVLKNFEIFTHKKTPVLESLINKVINLKACTFIKKRIPAQVFCWEYYEIFKNTYFKNICKRLLFNLTSLFVCLLACFHRTLEKTTGRVGVYLKDIIKILWNRTFYIQRCWCFKHNFGYNILYTV